MITHCFSRTANHSDGLTGLAIIHSENSKADSQLKLTNLHVHNGYDNPELSISQESTHTLENYLAEVESLIEYLKKINRRSARKDLKCSKISLADFNLSTLFIILYDDIPLSPSCKLFF